MHVLLLMCSHFINAKKLKGIHVVSHKTTPQTASGQIFEISL